MLKKYSISDILDLPSQHIPYYAGTFEGTEDPDVEWPHRHSYYSLVWFSEGSGIYVIDFEEYGIKPDRIFFVSPKQIHNWNYSQNSKGYVLTIDNALGSELNLKYSFPFLDIEGEIKNLLETIFPNIITNFLAKHDLSIDIQYIHQVIERFAQQRQSACYNTDPVIGKFKQLISETYNEIQIIDGYASSLHLSVEELNAQCKRYAGVSAKQYILDMKVTEAKRLLLYSNNNINEIAFHLGFEDSSYFSRIFRKKNVLFSFHVSKKVPKTRLKVL